MQLRCAGRCILALVAAATLVTADLVIDGTVCDLSNFSNTDLPFLYAIQTQEDFDSRFSLCNTIIGTIYLGANYVGSFAMNNVTNVTESIATWAVAFGEAAYINYNDSPGWNYSTPFLTSIQADSLVSLGGLVLPTIPAIKSLSMASLESVTESIEIYSNPTMSLNFPQLKNVTDIQILGGYSSLNMDQLVTVERNLYIDAQNSTVDDGEIYDNNKLKLRESPPIDISFASLINAPYISLLGCISSLYMPNLATASQPANPDPSLDYVRTGIVIQNFGDSLLNVTLPSLWNTTQIKIAGNLVTVSFPSLKTLFGSYTVYPYSPVAISLTPLQAADSINILGNVTSANFSSVQNLWTLEINTDGPFDSCKQIGADWSRMKHTVLPFQSAFDTAEETSYSCTDVPAPAPPFHLSNGARIGIGLGIGIPALAFFFWLVRCIPKRRRAKRNQKEMKRQKFLYMMVNLDRERREQEEDLPPAYTPASVTESAAEGSATASAIHDEATIGLISSKYESPRTAERRWN